MLGVKKSILLIIISLGFVYFSMDAAQSFRFALFTDLHIASANPNAAEDLLNAVNEVNTQQNIGFVLVTGDIANLGDTSSLRVAKQLLQLLKIPFYVIPGNHDFRWNVGVGSANFKRIFGDDKFFFIYQNFLFAGLTSVPDGTSATAYFQPSDINWLKRSLKKAGSKMPTFIVTHYPLLKGDVDNWKKLTTQLEKYNIKAILNGHYHRNVLLNFDGIPGIVNRSTLRNKNKLGGYSIYSVSDSIKVFEKRIGEPENLWLTLPYIQYPRQVSTKD